MKIWNSGIFKFYVWTNHMSKIRLKRVNIGQRRLENYICESLKYIKLS